MVLTNHYRIQVTNVREVGTWCMVVFPCASVRTPETSLCLRKALRPRQWRPLTPVVFPLSKQKLLVPPAYHFQLSVIAGAYERFGPGVDFTGFADDRSFAVQCAAESQAS